MPRTTKIHDDDEVHHMGTKKHKVVVVEPKKVVKPKKPSAKKIEKMMEQIEQEIEEIENLEMLIKMLTSTKKPKKTAAANKLADEVWADIEEKKIHKTRSMTDIMKNNLHLTDEPHYTYENLDKINDATQFKKVLKSKKPTLTSLQEEKLNEIIKMIHDAEEHEHHQQQHHQQQHHQQKPHKKEVKAKKQAKQPESTSWF